MTKPTNPYTHIENLLADLQEAVESLQYSQEPQNLAELSDKELLAVVDKKNPQVWELASRLVDANENLHDAINEIPRGINLNRYRGEL